MGVQEGRYYIEASVYSYSIIDPFYGRTSFVFPPRSKIPQNLSPRVLRWEDNILQRYYDGPHKFRWAKMEIDVVDPCDWIKPSFDDANATLHY